MASPTAINCSIMCFYSNAVRNSYEALKFVCSPQELTVHALIYVFLGNSLEAERYKHGFDGGSGDVGRGGVMIFGWVSCLCGLGAIQLFRFFGQNWSPRCSDCLPRSNFRSQDRGIDMNQKGSFVHEPFVGWVFVRRIMFQVVLGIWTLDADAQRHQKRCQVQGSTCGSICLTKINEYE